MRASVASPSGVGALPPNRPMVDDDEVGAIAVDEAEVVTLVNRLDEAGEALPPPRPPKILPVAPKREPPPVVDCVEPNSPLVGAGEVVPNTGAALAPAPPSKLEKAPPLVELVCVLNPPKSPGVGAELACMGVGEEGSHCPGKM